MADFKHISIDGTSYDAVPAGSYVTGVKGNNESTYRSGNVNITKANIGLSNVPNVTTNNQTPTFTEASTRANIASGETLSVLFGKIMKFFTDLKAVAFSGSYNDLSDTPTLVTGVKGSAESTYRTGNVNLSKTNVGLGNVPNVTTNNQTPTFSQASTRANIASGEKLSVLFGKIMKFFADLKTVAFTGDYSDLTGKPTIPTVNNATLTIKKNGTNVQTFTANASSNKTANITVPILAWGSFSGSITVAANSSGTANINCTPDDTSYSIVGVVGYNLNYTDFIPYTIAVGTGYNVTVGVKNLTNASITRTIYLNILFVKNN